MAGKGVFFSAHEGGAACSGDLGNLGKGCFEGLACRDFGEADAAVFHHGGVFGQGAELLAHVDVGDAAGGEGVVKGVAVELGMAPAGGNGADVDDDGDMVLLQEPDEVIDGVAGVADGVDGGFHVAGSVAVLNGQS